MKSVCEACCDAGVLCLEIRALVVDRTGCLEFNVIVMFTNVHEMELRRFTP
jgi:hypothetical protein